MNFQSFHKPFFFVLSWLIVATVEAMPTPVVLLDANFDDKKIDEPIGTGGAAVGEPIFVHGPLDAIVRKEPEGDDNLELELSAGPGASALLSWFEFLDSAEITDGVLQIRAELILGKAESFRSAGLYVREQGGASQGFANLTLSSNGTLVLSGAGIGPVSWPSRVLLEDRNAIELVFDMDEGRYWLWFNDEELAPPAGYAHGITARGIGRAIVSLAASTTAPRSARVDNLLVTWLPVPGDALFADGFEP